MESKPDGWLFCGEASFLLDLVQVKDVYSMMTKVYLDEGLSFRIQSCRSTISFIQDKPEIQVYLIQTTCTCEANKINWKCIFSLSYTDSIVIIINKNKKRKYCFFSITGKGFSILNKHSNSLLCFIDRWLFLLFIKDRLFAVNHLIYFT